MSSTSIILLLCSLVIISYLFEIISKRTGIPAVLFLVALGVLLNRMTFLLKIPAIDYLQLIPVLGTVGLILIVFEGALEIEYSSEKKYIFLRVLVVSIILLAASSAGIAVYLWYKTGLPAHRCLLNSIPFSIISSAIAIPSAAYLSQENREFITFESSLSDILGIVFFNYAAVHSSLSFYLGGKIVLELVLVSVVSLVFCMVLIYMLKSIEHNIKFILVLAVMVFLYALGKIMHVSSLIMVLMFGLMLKNINFIKSGFINRHFNNARFINDFNFMQQITAEGVFLIKTFFFIIFGFIIHPVSLLSLENISTALIISAIIYGARLITLAVVRQKIFPGIFYAPRGLISILLFLTIPGSLKIDYVNIDVLFIVVIITSVIMILGSFWRIKKV